MSLGLLFWMEWRILFNLPHH